jgi:hypothetical protein
VWTRSRDLRGSAAPALSPAFRESSLPLSSSASSPATSESLATALAIALPMSIFVIVIIVLIAILARRRSAPEWSMSDEQSYPELEFVEDVTNDAILTTYIENLSFECGTPEVAFDFNAMFDAARSVMSIRE